MTECVCNTASRWSKGTYPPWSADLLREGEILEVNYNVCNALRGHCK